MHRQRSKRYRPNSRFAEECRTVRHGRADRVPRRMCSSSFFRIPGFSALRSNCTHYRFGILSCDTTHASGDVIIFVRQGLSFSKFSTSSLSLLDPYSNYVGVSISVITPPVIVVVVVGYPTPSEGWGHGGRPWSPSSQATLQGLDQRS